MIVVSKAELVEVIKSRMDIEYPKPTDPFTNSAQQAVRKFKPDDHDELDVNDGPPR